MRFNDLHTSVCRHRVLTARVLVLLNLYRIHAVDLKHSYYPGDMSQSTVQCNATELYTQSVRASCMRSRNV